MSALRDDGGGEGGRADAARPATEPGAALAELRELIRRCEADPTGLRELAAAGDALADQVGGEAAFAWRLAALRATVAAPPDGDAVRERYGELLDLCRHEPARLDVLRPLGEEIRRREAEGTLSRAMVARTARRPRGGRR